MYILIVEKKKEAIIMATKKKTYDAKDFTQPVKELSRLMKETYLNTIDFSLSIAEENKKVLDKQVDYLMDAEKEYFSSVKDFYGMLPKDDLPFGKVDSKSFDDGWEKVLAFQKNFVDSFRGISDNAAVETHEIAKKNVLKAFSMFDETLDSIKV
jgi:hypothetical protein